MLIERREEKKNIELSVQNPPLFNEIMTMLKPKFLTSYYVFINSLKFKQKANTLIKNLFERIKIIIMKRIIQTPPFLDYWDHKYNYCLDFVKYQNQTDKH